MSPSDTFKLKRKKETLEDRVYLSSNPESYYTSQYFEAALRGGLPGIDRARSASEYFERVSDFGLGNSFRDKYEPLTRELPTSNGQRWNTRLPFTIGIICDNFLFASFEGSANFLRVTPANYEEAAERVDALFVTSVWNGAEGEWKDVALPQSESAALLLERVIPLHRSKGVPIVFYSKEDPPNYSKFLHVAKSADHIFTSAREVIEKYERDCPQAASIAALKFSVSAKHHNPVGSRVLRIPEVLFAGSWYNHKYANRRNQGLKILEGVSRSTRDLVIADRNSELAKARYAFPEQFIPHLANGMDHETLLRIQKSTEININLNTVSGSDTMFANRVIELQGMGSFILSTYSKGMNSLYPQIYMPDSVLDARDAVDTLSESNLRQAQMQGVRAAFTGNTNFDRMFEVFKTIGLVDSPKQRTIAVVSDDPEFAAQFVRSQVISKDVALTVFNSTNSARSGDSIAAIYPDKHHHYSEFWVQDALNAFKYVDVDTVAAPVDYTGPNANTVEHNFDSHKDISSATRMDWLSGESATPLAYNLQRDLVSRASNGAFTIRPKEDVRPILSVVVPIYNNGRHLEHKCIASLRRSSIFDRMQVILVDDGSTDAETISVVNRLEAELPNTQVFRFPQGGSGSASRPRNKGLELADAPYVTYLDPDNEAMNDAYAKLVEMVRTHETEFAIGDMVRFHSTRTLVNNVRYLKEVFERDGDGNSWRAPQNSLQKLEFRPMSMQALVADTAWLKSLGLEQPVGAVGQDSYFFQQLIHHTSKISILEEPVHIYFSGVENSTVNSLSSKFFKKYIPLETARVQWLNQMDLMGAYKSTRLDPYFYGWYLNKFDKVAHDERQESARLVLQIAEMYGDRSWMSTQTRQAFEEMLDYVEDRQRGAKVGV